MKVKDGINLFYDDKIKRSGQDMLGEKREKVKVSVEGLITATHMSQR